MIKAINTCVKTYKYMALVIYLHQYENPNQPKIKQNFNQKKQIKWKNM